MIEAMNGSIIHIDANENMTEMPELTVLYKSMQTILGDVTIDKTIIEPTEDIYDYIIEKIYLTPEYIDGASFKDKPKEKLLIAFNKFFFAMIEKHENTRRHTD